MDKINFYSLLKNKKIINPNYNLHKIKLPFRMLIASPSGSGKTNMLCNLIYHMDNTFHEIIICVKSADEPLYELMIDKLKNITIYENGETPLITNYSIIDKNTNRLKKLDNKQRLIIFDDLILDKNANKCAEEYYIKGRKLGFSMVYLGQSFYQIPKMIRSNSQYFILGRNLLKKDLRMILSSFPTDKTLDEFASLYNSLTTEDLDAIIIDIENKSVRQNLIGMNFNI